MNEKEKEKLNEVWKKYNVYSTKLSKLLGRTTNNVGEYAEFLAKEYYKGELLTASERSADVISKENKLIQVKSRRIDKIKSTQLNVIRSWDFDYLVVILFDMVLNPALFSSPYPL